MSIYQFKAETITKDTIDMSAYQDKVLLIVNTASACGFTPQYKELQALYQKYGPEKFAVLGFPCNQFGQQEKADEATINQFCELNFGVSFPLFAKIDVNGEHAAPLFEYLKQQAPGLLGSKKIKWNFTKFLVDSQGHVVSRYAPTTKPSALEKDIEKLLS
ncbi:glutathione peroxidase [Shewanella waksmanii]|uniref:glutathione peroxidase n=1 Tax=Shewanella waksmanii TaxID=213783 RepID=UPI0004917F3A|nr:glutathione peroxidase [Shewanella waksmanii]